MARPSEHAVAAARAATSRADDDRPLLDFFTPRSRASRVPLDDAPPRTIKHAIIRWLNEEL